MDFQTNISELGKRTPAADPMSGLVKLDDTDISQATKYVVSQQGPRYQFTASPGSVVSKFMCPTDAAPPGMSAGDPTTGCGLPEPISSLAAVPTMFQTKTAEGDTSNYFANRGSKIEVYTAGASSIVSPRQNGGSDSKDGPPSAAQSLSGETAKFQGRTRLEGLCMRRISFTVGDSHRPEDGELGRNEGMIGGGGFKIEKANDGRISISPYDTWKTKNGKGTEKHPRKGGITGLLPTYGGSYSLVNVTDVRKDYGWSKEQSYTAGTSVVSHPASKEDVQDLIDAGWLLKDRLPKSLR
jgi:hypothetical protein